MPYFVTDESAECSGWAVVKQDGEVMGCHQSKADAVEQMVAISVAEGIEPGGERDAGDPPAIIADIDGTIVTFDGDPIESVVSYLNDADATVYVVTARVRDDGASRAELEAAGLEGFVLIMKPDVEMDSVDFKRAAAVEILDDHEVLFAVDDDAEMRRMYGRLGIETKLPSSLRGAGRRLVVRALPEGYRPAISDDVPDGRACGNCEHYNEDIVNEDEVRVWCDLWEDWVRGDHYCDRWEPDDMSDDMEDDVEDSGYKEDEEEKRQVDLTVPGYVRAAARRGLELRAEGFGGDGLVERTIREARLMADGRISEDKVIRANAWAQRHAVDLEASQNSDSGADGWPGAGAVAHYLWGINPLNPGSARDWFSRKAEEIKADREEKASSSGSRKMKMDDKEFRLEVPRDNLVRKVEFRAEPSDDGLTLEGYAAVFNEWTDIDSYEGTFRERIAPGAFKKTISERMPVLQFDHGTHPLIGSIPLGVITSLREDAHGLKVKARLSDNWLVEPVRDAIRDGAISGMSFRFRVINDSWVKTRNGPERTINEIALYEAGPVVFPAYEQTSVGVRSREVLTSLSDPEVRGEIAKLLAFGAEESVVSATEEVEPQEHSTRTQSQRRALARLKLQKDHNED